MVEGRTVGIGLLGLGDTGRFLRDLVLQDSSAGRIVAAWDPSAELRSNVPEARPSLESVLDDPAVDRVVVAGPLSLRSQWVSTALVRGKSACVVAPLADDPEEIERLMSAAGNRIACLSTLRMDEGRRGFRGALRIVQADRLGPLRTIRYRLLHPPVLSGFGQSGGDSAGTGEFTLLESIGGPLVEQLVRLCNSIPKRVFCRVVAPQPAILCEGGELFLEVEFEGGVSARIEVDRRTCLTEHPGWIVEGERGAWKEGRIVRIQNDGEIFELPDEEVRTENQEPGIMVSCLSGQPFDLTVSRRTAEILKAARLSAHSRRVESI